MRPKNVGFWTRTKAGAKDADEEVWAGAWQGAKWDVNVAWLNRNVTAYNCWLPSNGARTHRKPGTHTHTHTHELMHDAAKKCCLISFECASNTAR